MTVLKRFEDSESLPIPKLPSFQISWRRYRIGPKIRCHFSMKAKASLIWQGPLSLKWTLIWASWSNALEWAQYAYGFSRWCIIACRGVWTGLNFTRNAQNVWRRQYPTPAYWHGSMKGKELTNCVGTSDVLRKSSAPTSTFTLAIFFTLSRTSPITCQFLALT